MTLSGAFETPAEMPHAGGFMQSEAPEQKPTATVGELIDQLVVVGSYLNQLYLQAHLIHLNIEGPLFLPIHEFLKQQYEDHIDQFDSVAEFVRSMDYLMPMCARGLTGAYKGFKHVKSYTAREALTTYVKNLENAGMMAKETGVLAREAQAPDVENYMADLVKMMFKAAWFLKATLRDQA
jgi:DNA-binding ferritin-like protein